MTPRPPDFDRIARPYRWLEYVVLGSLLQQTRTQFLPRLRHSRQALLFGDGDGRFVAALLKSNPHLTTDVVDTSAAMLRLLCRRTRTLHGPNPATRLRPHNRNALDYIPDRPHDLIVTHFFLDCLSQPQVNRLIRDLVPTLPPGALWVLSEFRIPPGLLHIPATIFIRALYFAFELLTGLQVNRLPDHATPLTRAGLTRIAHRHRLFGLLTAELWQKRDQTSHHEVL